MRPTGKLLLVAAIGAVWTNACVPAFATDISGAGSSFAFPLLSKWADAYEKATGIAINYRSIGSVSGAWLLKSEIVDFGLSDAPLGIEELAKARVAQFPIVVGGVVPVFNLKGVQAGELKMTGSLLADIFLGKITKWNDEAIATLNPNLALPDQVIVPVHRTADSGTRYIFANYLSKVSPDWKRNGDLNTPVLSPSSTGQMGNQRVAAFILATTGAIGYVEFTYAKQNQLAYVVMQNHDGKFVTPSSQSFQAAAASPNGMSAPSFNKPLTDQPGSESWPICGLTFALVNKHQRRSDHAPETLRFFAWVYRNGAMLAERLDYVPVSQHVVQLVEGTWADIKMPDGQPVWIGENPAPRQ